MCDRVIGKFIDPMVVNVGGGRQCHLHHLTYQVIGRRHDEVRSWPAEFGSPGRGRQQPEPPLHDEEDRRDRLGLNTAGVGDNLEGESGVSPPLRPGFFISKISFGFLLRGPAPNVSYPTLFLL